MLFVPDEHLSLRFKNMFSLPNLVCYMFDRGGPSRFKSFKQRFGQFWCYFLCYFQFDLVLFPQPLLGIFVVVLSPRFKKGLTKFMKCIDWEDEAEVAMAVELVELWEPIDVEVSADS